MSDAEYLTARGWTTDGLGWFDTATADEARWTTPKAIIAQRARDAAEERAAWDRYYAAQACAVISDGEGNIIAACTIASAASNADAMLRQRRERTRDGRL